jgi:membrane-associated protein
MIHFILHLDDHLRDFVLAHGAWVYGLLFAIIFAETGLVITPFLPGDSLLFAAGALAAEEVMDLRLVLLVIASAAIIGDTVNYAIGNYVGPRVFTAEDKESFWHRLLNRDHLMKAQRFFEKYGGMAVVVGRFVPIVRTFRPFVAGAGSMTYGKFMFYNVAGALLWTGLCVGGGYEFATIPFVKNNFTVVMVAIVLISLMPIVWGILIAKLAKHSAAEDAAAAAAAEGNVGE